MTLRARLTALATAVVALVLIACSAAVVGVQRRTQLASVDEALSQRADNLQPLARGTTVLPGEGDQEDSFLQLLDARGEVVAATANVAGLPATTTPAQAAGDRVGQAAVPRLSTHSYRILARPVPGGTLVVAKNVDDVQEGVDTLMRSLAIAVPLIVGLVGWLLWWLCGRVLASVETIRAEVAAIGPADLHRRVAVPGSRDEISRLVGTMNAMLDRVQQASERQKQFVADASHELRGPLARIRSTVEVASAHPHLAPPEDTLHEVLVDTSGMQSLLDDLLLLAQSEHGATHLVQAPVDLDDVVLADASYTRTRGSVAVDASGVGPARTRGDAGQLARLVRNLSENAARHATSVIRYELREIDGACELAISDDGPGIPADKTSAVFERFTRLDVDRSPETGGAGLGLAIVREIAARHGGTVGVQAVDPHGARLVVRLPRTP